MHKKVSLRQYTGSLCSSRWIQAQRLFVCFDNRCEQHTFVCVANYQMADLYNAPTL